MKKRYSQIKLKVMSILRLTVREKDIITYAVEDRLQDKFRRWTFRKKKEVKKIRDKWRLNRSTVRQFEKASVAKICVINVFSGCPQKIPTIPSRCFEYARGIKSESKVR
jgi:hypothetical protein